MSKKNGKKLKELFLLEFIQWLENEKDIFIFQYDDNNSQGYQGVDFEDGKLISEYLKTKENS